MSYLKRTLFLKLALLSACLGADAATGSAFGDDTPVAAVDPAPAAPTLFPRMGDIPLRPADPSPIASTGTSPASSPSASSGPEAAVFLPSQTTPALADAGTSVPASSALPSTPDSTPGILGSSVSDQAAIAPAPSAPPIPGIAPPPSSAPVDTWKNSYINLVHLLSQRGILTKKDSSDLISQAQKDASPAHAEASALLSAPASAPPSGSPDDTMRVSYVPETVKEQMRDEIKNDVLQEERDEHWATPNTVPEWISRYHVFGDFRMRYEDTFFPSGNDNTGVFHNFNAINTGAPFDTGLASNAANPPTYNVDQDRQRFRIRARIGAGIDLGDNFTVGLRIGTGQDDSPVTENQTIGLSNNGQGGDFSKYALWLDRAFLTYELGGTPKEDLTVTVGRFENPFFSSSMIWANDIGFDGMAVKAKYEVANGVTPFLTAGGFPVFNTDFNFATTDAAKFHSEDKYLFAVQGGTDWKITKNVNLKVAGALYYFENIEGKVSSPFTPLLSSDQGNTDDSRPSFAQNGNTYIALRDIVPDAANGFGDTDQYQYYGLATPFHDVALTAQLDFSQFDPFHISILGEVVQNVAFDRQAIATSGPPQSVGPVNNYNSSGVYQGGNTGYNVRLSVGAPLLQKFGDWNVNLTYRYVETDATVDGFTDSDFGASLAGTNLKGYILSGNFALSPRVWSSLQFMSADAIAGPPYQSDLIQADINAKF